MPRRIANVWAAPCSRCGAQTDAPCTDLGAPHRHLFGRRTHKERAKAVKALPTTSFTSGVLTSTLTLNSTNTTGIVINGTNLSVGPYTTSGTLAATTITANTIQYEAVWQGWVQAGHTIDQQLYYNQPVWDAWIADDEQRAAYEAEQTRLRDAAQARREQQNRERLAREQEQMENYLVAHTRALELLDDLLTEEERALRLTEQRVAVRGSDGHLYWIEMHTESVHGNIVRTDEHGCRLGRACVAPRMYDLGGDVMPTPDGWVGQYLGLKFDAETFLSHANWSGRTQCHLVDAAQVRQVAA
jgi:hypothetical protein